MGSMVSERDPFGVVPRVSLAVTTCAAAPTPSAVVLHRELFEPKSRMRCGCRIRGRLRHSDRRAGAFSRCCASLSLPCVVRERPDFRRSSRASYVLLGHIDGSSGGMPRLHGLVLT